MERSRSIFINGSMFFRVSLLGQPYRKIDIAQDKELTVSWSESSHHFFTYQLNMEGSIMEDDY